MDTNTMIVWVTEIIVVGLVMIMYLYVFLKGLQD